MRAVSLLIAGPAGVFALNVLDSQERGRGVLDGVGHLAADFLPNLLTGRAAAEFFAEFVRLLHQTQVIHRPQVASTAGAQTAGHGTLGLGGEN